MEVEKKQKKKQNRIINRQIKHLSELNITIDKICGNIYKNKYIPTIDELKLIFVIMNCDEYYYVIKSKKKYINNAIKRLEKRGYNILENLMESQYISNSAYLWDKIKEELIRENKIISYRNDFTLEISENDFIMIVTSIFDKYRQLN